MRLGLLGGRRDGKVLGLERRGITVLTGALAVAGLGLGVAMAEVPYVVMMPGPTFDTLGEQDGGQPVIDIVGAETTSSDGELRLTTASWRGGLSVADAIRAWFDPELAVVPEEVLFPPGQTPAEVEERNLEQMTRSQSSAEAAAMQHLGFPARVVVAEVVADGPGDGVLAAGDLVLAVNGEEVASAAELGPLVTAHPVGTTLTVTYERDGAEETAELTTEPDADDPDVPRIGVVAMSIVDHPYDLNIELQDVGGPSAGLMFALGIVDKLEPADLTGGQVIAGTGTIAADGTVGPVGAVPQKLVAAREVGAIAFLVPAANCPEAVANAQPGLVLVEVRTLAGAVAELATLRAGGTPTTCAG